MITLPQWLTGRPAEGRDPDLDGPEATDTKEPSAAPVHQGHDGWLFLLEGSNSVLDLYRHDSSFTDAMALDWVRLLADRRERLNARGIEYVHLAAPEKLTVLHRHFDGKLENPGGSPIRRLVDGHAADAPCLLDLVPCLSREVDAQPTYWKTDTHWSAWGCHRAYLALCEHLGLEANPDILDYAFTEGSLTLDLGARVSPVREEVARFYRLDRHSRRIYANPLVRYKENGGYINDASLHVGSHVIYVNDSPDAADKMIVLFGDSFSEYRNHLLTGMLAETVRELHFIWSASIDDEYVRRVRPDIVITELAERFMTRVPDDQLDIVELSHYRVRAHRTAQEEGVATERPPRPQRYQRRSLTPGIARFAGCDELPDSDDEPVLIEARDARLYLTMNRCLVTAFNGDVLARHEVDATRARQVLDEEPRWLRGTTLFLGDLPCVDDDCRWMLDILPKIALMRWARSRTGPIDQVLIGRPCTTFQRSSLATLGFDGTPVIESGASPYLASERLLHVSVNGARALIADDFRAWLQRELPDAPSALLGVK